MERSLCKRSEEREANRRVGQEGAVVSNGGMIREGLESPGLCRMQCKISIDSTEEGD